MSPPPRATKRTDSMRSPKNTKDKQPRRSLNVPTPAPTRSTRGRPAAMSEPPATPAPVPQGSSRRHARTGSAKIVKAQWAPAQNRLVHAGKEALRAHALLNNPFPPEGGSKSQYCRPIITAYVNSRRAAADMNALFEDLCDDEEELEDLCINVRHSTLFCIYH